MIKSVIQNKLINDYTEIMTYQHLNEDLKEIENEFENTKIRFLKDPLELSSSIGITGAITKRKLLIEFEVPMVDRSVYMLERIIKLPIRRGDEVFVFDIPHLHHLVQNEARVYIPMQQEDLSLCHEITPQKSICIPQRETHYADPMSCESNILFHMHQNIVETCYLSVSPNNDGIVNLNKNQYFISPKNNISLVEKCVDQNLSNSIIDQAGIITLDTECELYSDKVIFYPKNTRVHSGITNLPVPNNTLGIEISDLKNVKSYLQNLPPSPQLTFKNLSASLLELKEKIATGRKTLNNLKKIRPIENHWFRNYVIGGSLTIVLITLICLIKKCLH